MCRLLVEKQGTDAAVGTTISYRREVTCLESSPPPTNPQWLGKEKGPQSLEAKGSLAGSDCDFVPVKADVFPPYAVSST